MIGPAITLAKTAHQALQPEPITSLTAARTQLRNAQQTASIAPLVGFTVGAILGAVLIAKLK